MIRQELLLIYMMVILGIIIVFVYDVILVFREIVKHSGLIAAIGDILYWAMAAAATFIAMYRINEGVMRGYAIAGMAVSGILFQWAAGSRFINVALVCWKNLLSLFIKYLKNPFYRCIMKKSKISER